MKRKTFKCQKYLTRLLSMIPLLAVLYIIYVVLNIAQNTNIIIMILMVLMNILILVAYFRITQNLEFFQDNVEYGLDENNIVHIYNYRGKEIILDDLQEIFAYESSLFGSNMYCIQIRNGKKKTNIYSTAIKRECRFMECSTYHFFKFVVANNKQLKNVKNKQGTFNKEWYRIPNKK